MDLGSRVCGVRFTLKGNGFRVQDLGFRLQGVWVEGRPAGAGVPCDAHHRRLDARDLRVVAHAPGGVGRGWYRAWRIRASSVGYRV